MGWTEEQADMKTMDQLKEEGVIKMKTPYEYANALVECYPQGGVKGVWINGRLFEAYERGNEIFVGKEEGK